MPPDPENLKSWIKGKRRDEEKAFAAAVAALEAALDAKMASLHAWDVLFQAKGAPVKLNREAAILSARRHRCKDIVQRALRVSALNRLGF